MAKALYLKGLTPKEIASQLNLPSARIIYHWADVGEWREQIKVVNIEDAIARRIALLTDREKNTWRTGRTGPPDRSPRQIISAEK